MHKTRARPADELLLFQTLNQFLHRRQIGLTLMRRELFRDLLHGQSLFVPSLLQGRQLGLGSIRNSYD